MVITVLCTWVFVKGVFDKVTEDYIRFESLRLHRRRALQSDETCEWLNLLLNRWWVFSSGSIFSRLKTILDPRLQEAKPSFVEAISLKHLSLGDRTPLLRSVRSWDAMAPFRSSCSLHTPAGLDLAPTHTMAILCDLVLDSDSFSAVLAARVGHKGMGVELDVGVEHLVIDGRVLVTLFLDSEAPFPHIARLTLSFTERPKVSFKVKILKSVQMMEMPVLKNWIHNLVTDALATAWVDPGQLEVNIHSSEAFVPEHRPGVALAQGVLTVTLRIQRGTSGSGWVSEDDKWVVVGVGGKTHVSPTLKSALWQYNCSFLVSTPLSSTTLILKIKSKKLITTTITQFELPLSQYGFEYSKVSETVVQKKGAKVMGGNVPPLNVKMEYTPLTAVNLDAPHPAEDIGKGAGVLYIVVHGADNLMSTDYSPSPYCLVFNSRRKVKTTHYVAGSTSPRWECGVEELSSDVSSACLTFVVCSLPRNPKLQDGDLLGIHTLNLSTIQLPLIHRQLPLNRNISSPSPEENDAATGSTITVSIVFRSVPSVSGVSTQENPNFLGMPLPMPLASSAPAASPCLISSSSASTGTSVTPPAATTSSSSSRRSSAGPVDDEEQSIKKKSNSHWLNQAKHLLGSSHDSDGVRRQDLGDILASGLGLAELTIIRARDLVARDLNGFSDPYCVVKVNGEVKYRTRVKKKTLDPVWNESLMTHLPKKNQSLVITLWDHDTFGLKDFLGSLSLQEEQVRSFSGSSAPIWCPLQGVKSGSLELKVRVISEDFEFDSGNRARISAPLKDVLKTSSEETDNLSSPTMSTVSSLDSESGEKDLSNKKNSEIMSCFLSRKDSFKLSLPNTSVSKSCLDGLHNIALLRASSIPSLIEPSSKDAEQEARRDRKEKSNPLYTPSRARKSGAEILASAIALAKAESKESITKPEIPKHMVSNLVSHEDNESKEYLEKKDCVVAMESSSSSASAVEEKDLKERANLKASSSLRTVSNTSSNDHFKSQPKNKTDSIYEMESIQPLEVLTLKQNLAYKSKDDFTEDSASDVPRISVNDQCEDDFGFAEGSTSSDDGRSIEKSKIKRTKKSSDVKGLRAMKQKVYKGFGHPLRRFRSEANVQLERHKPITDSSSLSLLKTSLEEFPDACVKNFHCSSHLGVGGGESDASELLVPPVMRNGDVCGISHAWSQPNLSIPLRNVRSWIPIASPLSTQVSSSSSTYISDRSIQANSPHLNACRIMSDKTSLIAEKSSSSDGTKPKMVFSNVRGILRKAKGLHIPKAGVQLFVRIRISEERSGGKITTKTVGRSRLVPGSSSPVFEYEWGTDNDLSHKSQIVLEVRTSSRDLMSSICVPLSELFEDSGSETCGSVEKWFSLDGGASVLLKVEYGGDTPPPLRRRSLFRSWSFHKIGKLYNADS